MSRKDRIRASLDWSQSKGIIRGWYAQSNMPGTRWTLEGVGFHVRVFSTSEVEAFLLGASEGRTTGVLDAP
jgi:hypothetical protein